MNSHSKLASLLGAGAALWLSAGSTWGQGCIVGRQCSPGEISGSNYLPPHQYDLSFDYRGFTADKHYNGTARQYQREKIGNFVVNRQNIFDVTGTLGVTKQLSVSVDIPYIHSGWSIPLPVGSIGGASPGPRAQQNSQGLGDISLGLKYWVLDTEKHPNGNVALGVGVKLSTGKDNVTTDFPDITGEDRAAIKLFQTAGANAEDPREIVALHFLQAAAWKHLGQAAEARTELETVRHLDSATKDEKKEAQKQEDSLRDTD